MRGRGWLYALGLTVAALLLAGRGASALLVDHDWHAAMGITVLWRERWVDTALLQGGAWLAGTGFTLLNLLGVRRTILAVAVPARVANLELTAVVPARRLAGIILGLSAAVGLALATPLTDWTQVALARHGVPFGEYEGYLDRDLGFYVYWLPLEESLYLWALVTLVTVTTMTLAFYALTHSLRLDGRRVVASSHVRRHVSVLGALLLLLLAWSFRLDAFDLLRDGSGPDGLFTRVDHVVTLRMDALLAVGAAIGSPILLRAGWMGQGRLALLVIGLVLGGSLALRQVAPRLLARGDHLGEPGRREAGYLLTRTLVSRRAYDVDAVRVSPDDPTPAPGRTAPRAPLATLDRSASAWDGPRLSGAPTSGASGAELAAAAISWGPSADGALSALSVRRPVVGEDRWRLLRLDVTRDPPAPLGTGVPGAGEPWGGDALPLVAPGLEGARVVPAPAAGVLGTPLDHWVRRVAHAWDARDPALLATAVAGRDRELIVLRRDVRDRVAAIAPIFAQGSNVLPLLHRGRVTWTLELYSASGAYPLSQRWLLAGGVRTYFRHAATALVDAATGEVRLLPSARPDPLLRTWMRLVPAAFTSAASVEPELLALLPPITDGALAQVRTLARYGTRHDARMAATPATSATDTLRGTGSATTKATARATAPAALPGPRSLPDSVFRSVAPDGYLASVAGRPVVAWSVPLLAGDRVDGVATVTGGHDRATWWEPLHAAPPRWSTWVARLDSLLDSLPDAPPDREAQTVRGRPRLVMTDRGPLLLQGRFSSGGDAGWTLGAVAVATPTTAMVAPTLGDLLGPLGGGPARPPGTTPAGAPAPSAAPPGAAARRLYDAMRAAMRRGDWVRFGAAFDSLGAVLGRQPDPP